MEAEAEFVKLEDYKKTKIVDDISQKGFSFVSEDILKEAKITESEVSGFLDDLEGENGLYAIDDKSYGLVRNEYKIRKDDKDETRRVYFIYDRDRFVPRRIISLVDFLYCVFEYEDEDINRYFRGQKAHYDLLPSLFREDGKYVEKEMELNAKVYNDRPEDFADCHSTFEKLVRLKHYVHASRLIDISSSPLVALYFACTGSSPDKEVGVVSEVYCRKEDEKFSVSSDTVVMLTAMTNTKLNLKESEKKKPLCLPCKDTVALKGNFDLVCPNVNGEKSSCYYNCWPKDVTEKTNKEIWEEKKNCLKEDSWANKYIGELSHQCKKEGMSIYWDDVCFNELNQCILVKPPLNNDRIVRQQGSFIMCGMNPKNIYEPPESLYEFFRYPEDGKNKDWKAKFYYILPEDRRFILEELKLFGMDDYYFFPELEKEIEVVKASVKKKELSDEEKKKEEERLKEKERWKKDKTVALKELLED